MERKLIAVAVSSALAVPMAAQAVEFSVSGHVNRAIMIVDGKDGPNDGELQHVDANSSESRFGFRGSGELDNGMEAGATLVLGIGDAKEIRKWRTRVASVFLASAGGTITLGQGHEATDGMIHARLGGPSWLGGVTNWCSYVSSGPACATNDGNRNPVLRYDTPAIGPAVISLSAGNDDFLDAQLKIAGSMGDAGYDVRIGHITEYDKSVAAEPATLNVVDGRSEVGEDDYVLVDLGTDVVSVTPPTAATTKDAGDITAISAAVSFGQGTSVAAAWNQKNTGDESEHMYVELDHSYGPGSIGVYYKTGENNDADGSLWGIGVGHGLGGGVTAYAGYRQIQEDGQKDIDLIVAGMRVQFN